MSTLTWKNSSCSSRFWRAVRIAYRLLASWAAKSSSSPQDSFTNTNQIPFSGQLHRWTFSSDWDKIRRISVDFLRNWRNELEKRSESHHWAYRAYPRFFQARLRSRQPPSPISFEEGKGKCFECWRRESIWLRCRGREIKTECSRVFTILERF